MLIIKNMSWNNIRLLNSSSVKDIINIIRDRLKEKNVKVVMRISKEDNGIVFDTTDRRIFSSDKENYIKLPKEDKRIQKLGRDHLLSYRVTQAQMDYSWDTINKLLDNLGVVCDIELVNDNNKVTLRTKTEVHPWIKERTYPKEKI